MAEQTQERRRRIVGVSTKMYFTAARTAAFVNDVLVNLSTASSLLSAVDVFIIPDHVTLTSVIAKVQAAGGSSQNPYSSSRESRRRVLVGAQNCCHSVALGPFTGEVSPAVLAEVGCDIVELGHAERRRLLGETDESTATKANAVAKHGMLPLVCVGEVTAPASAARAELQKAADEVMVQVRSVLAAVPDEKEVVLAYEPVWAIGAAEPAPVEHVVGVVGRIRESRELKGRKGTVRIMYGGSAGPGLFEKLKNGGVDGLFLGRFAHDPQQFFKTICEVAMA